MGRRTKPGLHLEYDLQEGYAALGFVREMTMQVDTDYYMADVIAYTHASMASEFDDVVAAAARTQEGSRRLNHVYEPGQQGIQDFQLWEHKLYGRGKNMQASFEWRPSTFPILSPEERKDDPSDPMSRVPQDVIDKLSDEEYVFWNRAAVMEYGLKTHIEPVNSKFLFIPSFQTRWFRNRKQGTSTPGNYRFDKMNMPDFTYRNPQDPSGADGTVGQFTAMWVSYWSGGGADEVWDSRIKPRIEAGLLEAEAEIGKAVRRVKKGKRNVSIRMGSFNDVYAAQEAGANLARAFIKGKARSYREAAKYIEKNGYFGGEREF